MQTIKFLFSLILMLLGMFFIAIVFILTKIFSIPSLIRHKIVMTYLRIRIKTIPLEYKIRFFLIGAKIVLIVTFHILTLGWFIKNPKN